MSNPSRDTDKLKLHRSLAPLHIDQLVALFQTEWWTKGRNKADVEKMLQSGGPLSLSSTRTTTNSSRSRER